MSVMKRNNVRLAGPTGGQPMVFVHGFGCDQNMWRFVSPAFTENYRVVLLDQVGFGNSDLSAYDPDKYDSLQGYADDVLEVCEELGLSSVIFVGHSVSAMIGVLAALKKPEQFDSLVMVAPSPRYINENGYVGGFSSEDIDGLLESLESNYLGWSGQLAPAIMGNADRPELGEELTNSFCRTDPRVARQFARVTFLSDNRRDLVKVEVPSLILQCSNDVLAPPEVGEYVHRSMPNSLLVHMEASGHCPNLSAPEETTAAIRSFLDSRLATRS